MNFITSVIKSGVRNTFSRSFSSLVIESRTSLAATSGSRLCFGENVQVTCIWVLRRARGVLMADPLEGKDSSSSWPGCEFIVNRAAKD